MNKPGHLSSSRARAAAKGPRQLPPGTDTTDERLLDEAINETFPASDPISPASSGGRDSDRAAGAEPQQSGAKEMVQDDPDVFHFPTQDNHPGMREERIRLAAYRRFIARGGEHGRDVDDWVAAEAEIEEEATRPPKDE